MLKLITQKDFKNGSVFLLETEDGYPVEVTDTFLPFYTKDAVGRKQNRLSDNDLGSREDRWMIGVSTMSGCPCHCRFCFVPGTMIYTTEFKYVKIEDVMVNDKVVSNQITLASRKVTGSEYASMKSIGSSVTETMHRKYSGKVIVITTENGNTIKCTPEHPIPVKRKVYRKKFIPANKVLTDDLLICSTPIADINDKWIIGWLSGFIDGDGVYCKNTNRKSYKTSVSQTDVRTMEFCYSQMKRLGIRVTKLWDNGNNNLRFSFGEEGKSRFDEIVSQSESSIDFKRGYLAGFWDAEGFSLNNNDSYRVCGTNTGKLEKIVDMLCQFGYRAEIKLYKSNEGNDKDQDCFMVESNLGWVKFCAIFRPQHSKAIRFNKHNSKSFSSLERIRSIRTEDYDGEVYNIETTSSTYFANNILVHNCATGTMKKCGYLTSEEIMEQVFFVLGRHENGVEKAKRAKEFKINYTRMGEPFLNVENLKTAIRNLSAVIPNTHHYVSTIGIKGADYSWIKGNITLQVSLHSLRDEKRDWLIPFKNKVSIRELGEIRTESRLKTTVNMTLVEEDDFDIEALKKYFDPKYFFIKLSPINPNVVSEGNGMGMGVIESENMA